MFHLVVVYLCNFELLFCRTLLKRDAIFNKGTWMEILCRDSTVVIVFSRIAESSTTNVADLNSSTLSWRGFLSFWVMKGCLLLLIFGQEEGPLDWAGASSLPKDKVGLLFLHRILDCNRHFPCSLNSSPRLVLCLDRLDQIAWCLKLWRCYCCRNVVSC